MAGISSPGIGSGLDVNSIVSGLVDAEREVFDQRYEANQLEITEKISAFGTIKSTLTELSDVLFELQLSTTFSQRKVDYTDTYFDLEVGSAAQPGNFSLDVQQVATSHKVTSAAFGEFEALGAGDITINVGASSFTFETDTDDTLSDLRDAINADAATSAAVTASVITGDDGSYLVLEAVNTGASETISIDVTDDDTLAYDSAGLSRLAYSPATFALDNTFATGEVLGQSGDITITNGTENQTISIAATDTIEDVINNINTSGLNLTASLEDDGAGSNRLVLTSANTYPDQNIGIAIVSDSDGDTADAAGVSKLAFSGSTFNFTENTQASDAEILVNGSITATNSTNEFSGVLEGVIVNVKEVTTSSQNVTVELDQDSIVEQLETLVEKFNAVIDIADQYTGVDTVEGTVGLLTGDSTVRQLINRVRTEFSNPVTLEDESVLSLSQLGITTNQDGSISIDSAALTEAVEENFEDFGEFFAGDEGLATILYDVVDEYDKFQGLIDNRIDGLQSLADLYDEEKSSFDERMISYEERLYAQFLAMDTIVAGLNATSDFLDQQLDNLPGSSRSE